MPRITKVYTRTGDDGTTALGSGARVPKTSQRIEAYGTVDELNAVLGVVLAVGVSDALHAPVQRVQNELFHVGADLCVPEADKPNCPGPRVEERHCQELETFVTELARELEPLRNFILPDGSPAGAQLHVARTVCRRAEREVARLAAEEPINPLVLVYLNRLSDALFVMARYENKLAGRKDTLWDSLA